VQTKKFLTYQTVITVVMLVDITNFSISMEQPLIIHGLKRLSSIFLHLTLWLSNSEWLGQQQMLTSCYSALKRSILTES